MYLQSYPWSEHDQILYFDGTHKVSWRKEYVTSGPKTPLKYLSIPVWAKVWVLLLERILEN